MKYIINDKGDFTISGTEIYESIDDVFRDQKADFSDLQAKARQEINRHKSIYLKDPEINGCDNPFCTDSLSLSNRDFLIINKQGVVSGTYDNDAVLRKGLLVRKFYLRILGKWIAELYLSWIPDPDGNPHNLVPVIFSKQFIDWGNELQRFYGYLQQNPDDIDFYYGAFDDLGGIQLYFRHGCYFGFKLDGYYLFYAWTWI